MRRPIAASVVLATAAALAAPMFAATAYATTNPVVTAYSDTRQTPYSYEQTNDGNILREACADAAPKAARLSLATALRHAGHLVSKASHGKGARKLAHSASGKTEDAAMTGAVSAVVDGSPVAALAALLRAHHLARKDPVPLIDGAALLAQMGKPNEALALLRAVKTKRLPAHAPFTVPWPAVMSAARGAAQLDLHHYDAAITAYAAARKANKLLPEANQGRAAAYACKNDDQHAMVFLTAGTTRQQFPDGDFVGGDPTSGGQQVAGPEVLDTHHGKTITLPNFKLPQTVAEGAALNQPYQNYIEGKLRDQERAVDAAAQAASVPYEKFIDAPTTTPATAGRAQDILHAVAETGVDPSVKPLWDKAWAAEGVLSEKMTSVLGQAPCSDKGASQGELRADTIAFDTDWRKALAADYRLGTALAANLKTPAAHEYAIAQARSHAWNNIDFLAHEDSRIDFYDWLCQDEQSGSGDPVSGSVATPPSAACPTGIQGMAIKFKLFGITVSVSCEVVSASVATKGWIGAFVSGTYDFGKRQLTIFGGPQVSVSTPDGPTKFGGSVKDGIYVTVGDKGIEDIGARYQHGVTSTVGSVSTKIAGDKMDFTFVGAFSSAFSR
ncbi:hypothetical protein [Nocardioides terrisoli]|uniref:hypothetical protein n=1 Tax=Nocardioides terrisoli TaxID=3388267 RepID=UPI00287B85F5|nr:hypothetical protein [Nocardioides marmorisolisilvae]